MLHYFNVNMCLKSLSKIMSFSSTLRIIYEFSQVVKTLVTMMINDFENSNFSRFISNYCTCFHNILKTLSSKHIKEMCNINMIFDTKT
jgi:hypothetical protein